MARASRRGGLPALGPNGAGFVRIAPSWLAQGRRGCAGGQAPGARIARGPPALERDQVALDAAENVRPGGRRGDLGRVRRGRGEAPDAPEPRGRASRARRGALARPEFEAASARAIHRRVASQPGPGAAPLTPGRADATSDFDATLGTTMTAASSRRPAPPHPRRSGRRRTRSRARSSSPTSSRSLSTTSETAWARPSRSSTAWTRPSRRRRTRRTT